MITSTKQNNNKINQIIKEYIENDRFSTKQEYEELVETLISAFSEKDCLLLIVSLEENKLKFIKSYDKLYLIKNTKGNDIILGSYWHNDFKRDLSYDKRLSKNSDKIKGFVKSDVFKNRLLDIFSKYNIEKLNGDFNKIDALERLKISINEASLLQKIDCYFSIYSDSKFKSVLRSSINFELESKSKEEQVEIRKKCLNELLKDTMIAYSGWAISPKLETYVLYNDIFMKYFFEKTDNELDILLDTLINYLENVYNEKVGELKNNFLNKKLSYLNLNFLKSYTYRKFDTIFNSRFVKNWIKTSKITNDEKRKFLRLLGTNNFSIFIEEDTHILSLIKILNNDYIYTLKFNNNSLLKNSGLEKFYTNSLFEDVSLYENSLNSSVNLIKIPTYVKELYIPKNEYMKFKVYIQTLNKDIKSVIPETTKIIFVEDVLFEDFESRLV